MLNLSSYIELNAISVIEKGIKVNLNAKKLDSKPVNIEFKTNITSNFNEIIKNKNNKLFYVIVSIIFDNEDESKLKINGTLKHQFIFNIIDFNHIKNTQEIDIMKYTILIAYLEIRNQISELLQSIGADVSIKLPVSSNKMFNFATVSELEK